MNRDGRCGGAATVRWAAYGGESADGVPAQMVVVVSSSTLFRREGVVPQCSTCDVHVQCNVCIRGLEGGGGEKRLLRRGRRRRQAEQVDLAAVTNTSVASPGCGYQPTARDVRYLGTYSLAEAKPRCLCGVPGHVSAWASQEVPLNRYSYYYTVLQHTRDKIKNHATASRV
jgi:hypothetical protein